MRSVISVVQSRYRDKEDKKMITGSTHSCTSHPVGSLNLTYEDWEQYCSPFEDISPEQLVNEYFNSKK